jgi:hypothetical protein
LRLRIFVGQAQQFGQLAPRGRVLAVGPGKLRDDEWQELVDRKYKGRAVVLDVDVRKEATGGYHVELRRPLAAKIFRHGVCA